MHRVVDGLFRLPLATRFLLLALCGAPLLWPILAYGLWIDHWPVAKSGHPAFDDLSNLWLGVKAALSGDYGNLFRRDLHELTVAREFGAPLTNQVWSYPPTIMLALMPLALLPGYGWFALVWVGGGLALFTAALLQRDVQDGGANWPSRARVWIAAILLPGTMLCINAGQTGMLTSAILFFGVLLAERRPALAGLILALLVAKPHLGLALPVVLLALGAYRAVLWTAVFAALYLALTVAVLGFEPWHLFLTITLPEHVRYVEDVAAGPDEPLKLTLFMLLRTLGLSKSVAMGLHVATALGVLAALAALVRSESNRNIRFLAVALATLLTSPYLLGYELVLAALAVGRVVLDPEASRRLGDVGVFAFCAMLSFGHFASAFWLTAYGANPLALFVLGAYVWLTYPPARGAILRLTATTPWRSGLDVA